MSYKYEFYELVKNDKVYLIKDKRGIILFNDRNGKTYKIKDNISIIWHELDMVNCINILNYPPEVIRTLKVLKKKKLIKLKPHRNKKKSQTRMNRMIRYCLFLL